MCPFRGGRRLLVLSIALWPCAARAHDPSAWGGLFRTRDGGATWLAINSGSFVERGHRPRHQPRGAQPPPAGDRQRRLASRNGGRDWTVEAPDVLVGAAFAVAYDRTARARSSRGPRRSFGATGTVARHLGAGRGRTGARDGRGSVPARVYLAGWKGVYAAMTGARPGSRSTRDCPESTPMPWWSVRALRRIVHVVAGGQLWASLDGGRHWARRQVGAADRSRRGGVAGCIRCSACSGLS